MAEIDYDAVIAELEAERETLDATIQFLRRRKGGTVSNGSTSSRATPTASFSSAESLPSDAFFGMSIPDAVKKFLAITKKKQTTKDLVIALGQGGLNSSASNMYATVAGVLGRIYKNGGDIVRVGKGEWGLAEWYPGLRRKKSKANDTDIDDLVGERRVDE